MNDDDLIEQMTAAYSMSNPLQECLAVARRYAQVKASERANYFEEGVVYMKHHTKDNNPKKAAWYNTDKGKLFWYALENSWSCNDERLSEEYPSVWYEQIKA